MTFSLAQAISQQFHISAAQRNFNLNFHSETVGFCFFFFHWLKEEEVEERFLWQY